MRLRAARRSARAARGEGTHCFHFPAPSPFIHRPTHPPIRAVPPLPPHLNRSYDWPPVPFQGQTVAPCGHGVFAENARRRKSTRSNSPNLYARVNGPIPADKPKFFPLRKLRPRLIDFADEKLVVSFADHRNYK